MAGGSNRDDLPSGAAADNDYTQFMHARMLGGHRGDNAEWPNRISSLVIQSKWGIVTDHLV